MIPRGPKNGPGTSFKGAATYYLHDKRKEFNKAAGQSLTTSERVEWTGTINLATDDPEKAWQIMAATALSQNELKKAAGLKAGKRCTAPVYVYSLSWDPSEKVDRAEMERAAKETLKVLGFADRQALLVCHNDTKHPHVHVIVNRVHPETGRATHAVPALALNGINYKPRKHELGNDQLALSTWAEAYQKERGQDYLTPNRAKNNNARKKGEFVKDTASPQWQNSRAAEGRRKRDAYVKHAFEKRQSAAKNLNATHKGERDALFDLKEQQITQSRADIREQNRPKWAALYKEQAAELKAIESQPKPFLTSARAHAEKLAEQKKERLSVHAIQQDAYKVATRQQTKTALAAINKSNQVQLRRLRDTQTKQAQDLAQLHSRQSKEIARAIAKGEVLELPAEVQKEGADRPAPSQIAPTPPTPAPSLKMPAGTAQFAQGQKALWDAKEQRIAERLAAIKEQNRGNWGELFAQQRDEIRQLQVAQKSALPRLIQHLKNRDPNQNLFIGSLKALLGSKQNLAAIEKRHEAQRKRFGQQVRKEKDQAVQQEEKTYQRDLAVLEREQNSRTAALEKAVREGQKIAPTPERQVKSGAPKMSEAFKKEMRRKIEETEKKREEERKRGKDKGRERDFD